MCETDGIMGGIELLSWVVFSGLTGLVFLTAATFAHERAWRALARAAVVGGPLLVVVAILLFADLLGQPMIGLAVDAALLVVGITILVPMRSKDRDVDRSERPRVDERDAVFHRFYRLEPGSPEYEAYYAEHPEKRDLDDKVRSKPKLGSPSSKSYEPLASPFMEATFSVLGNMTDDVDRTVEPFGGDRVPVSPEEAVLRIEGFARFLGADLIGFTALDAANVYSHIGRSPGPWGEPVDLDHSHAIAIAVAIDHEMVRHAPAAPTLTDTAVHYFEAAKIALIIARYIKLLGYEARPHVDGNYRVMCVPVAVDAGLGELGRLGLLVTPSYGPRVRLSVVTTDLELRQSEPVRFGLREFCGICLECATQCPSGSIDRGAPSDHRGVSKWCSEQDSCYRYWRSVGTDCAICIKVCPYSHPDGVLHRLVRWAIQRNGLARRLALWGDRFFYGRGGAVAPPRWHR